MSASTGAESVVHDDLRGRIATTIANPVLGRRPRRTALTLAALAALVALHLASHLASREVAGVRAQTTSPAFDTLSAIVIVVSLVAILAGPFCYALWNGGPALSFAIPLVPIAFGELVARRWVLDVDAVVALTTGVVGAALALYATEVAATGSARPWRRRRPAAGSVLFVAVVAVGSAIAVTRFVLVAPDRLVDAYTPFAGLWLVALAVGGAYGVDWLRRRRDRSGRATDGLGDSHRS